MHEGPRPPDRRPRGRPFHAGMLVAVVAVAAVLLAAGYPDVLRLDGRGTSQAVACGTAPGAASSAAWWRADMEDGTLADWSAGPPGTLGSAGGGEFDTPPGRSTPTRATARWGAWSAQLELPGGKGATRLFRWQELRTHRTAVTRVWLLIPRAYRPTGPRRTGRFWDVFQFKSRSASGRNDPLWFVNVTSAHGRLRLELIWWSRTLQGPHRRASGFRRLRQRVATVPVGRWFQLSARLRQSKDFDGLLCVWQDGRLLFGLHDVRTSYANCAYNDWCAENEWSVNNYSDGLSPSPSVIFADGASIAPR
jgi:hypothetical protein